ncbi:FAD/NAD(P)-binding protein [Albimonas sp. CAU 1670]|uniref:FAD/NAD(P)-binding protein n=1 Tax=Albimonas sp. CAU 1670 TaxID=3032599 RepID=UPI0023DB2E79|nr:FAD/NAD(P)-binding protein [Albimonas sp. CAU 1670]MDF2231827.1 FAD/NAD(P)-binding protein [Albimonas sp. CAU 1670]
MAPRVARVLARRREAADVWTLKVEAPGGAAPPRPGQFAMLTAFGVGEIPVSFSGDPGDAGRWTHTIRAVGAVSAALAGLRRGQVLGLRGPFGSGWPIEAAEGREALVVAGGLGLAPVRPAILALLARPRRAARVALALGARSPAQALFARDRAAWARRGVEVETTVDHAGPDWRGHVGAATALIPRLVRAPERTLAFVCGPEIMMRFAADALREAGVAADAIHLSMERNMKCAVGLCGHCQFGGDLLCRDGPVAPLSRLGPRLRVREL